VIEAEVAHLKEQLSSRSADEVKSLKAKLHDEKAKTKHMWYMNCSQSAEQESLLNLKLQSYGKSYLL